jgi:LEA14-like dessication related protein
MLIPKIKKSWTLVLTTLLILSFLFLSGCLTSFRNPELKSIDQIHVDKINFKNIDLRFNLLISNPNNYSIKLKSVHADVYFKEKIIGSIISDTLLVLKKNSTSRIGVSLNSSPEKILGNLPGLIEAFYVQKAVNLKIDGKVRVKARGIHKRIRFELSEMVKL